MSVINKKPLINTILDGLSSSELSSLKACINGQGPAPIFRSLKPISNAHLTTSDYGVKPIKLELAIPLGGMSVYEGYLIYNASMCYVISYASEADQLLTILQVDVNNNKAEIVNGSLSILGLRSELDDASEAADGEVTQGEMETYVSQAIEADKNILSQIEVVNEDASTAFIFPKGVLPIKFCHVGNDYIFMNYSSGTIVDGNGDESDAWAMSITADSRISLEYQSHGGTIDIIDELYFINFAGNIDASVAGNWYTILNATKMYAHKINFSSSDSIRFISPFSYQYDIENLMRTFINYGISMLISSADFGSGKILAMNRILDQQKLTVIYYDGSETAITTVNIQYTENPQNWTDTVTPL